MTNEPAERRRPPPAEELGAASAAAVVAPWLMELLVCPIDKSALDIKGNVLVCQSCGRRYPVRDGISVMIPEEVEYEQKF